jgi:hypothetical protein
MPETPDTGGSRQRGGDVDDVLAAWLAEYQCLRAEIEWLINDGTRYQNFAITLVGIIGAAIGWLLKEAPIILIPTLLVVPFVFCLLGFLYSRQHQEVYIVAAYLKDYVRPRVRELVGDESLWGWEEFKSQEWRALSPYRRFKPFGLNDIVFLLRAMLFILPSIVALSVVVISFLDVAPLPKLELTTSPTTIVIIASVLFDTSLVLLLVRHLLLRGRMPHELFKSRNWRVRT